MMLTLAKRATEMHAIVKDGTWGYRLGKLPYDLYGKTVLIVGLAASARALPSAASPWRWMSWSTIPISPPLRPRPPAASRSPISMRPLPRADFVTIHCPKTPETVGLFNAARLALMKPAAYLINNPRAAVSSTRRALHAALVSGRLAGAGLDVFEQEPPPLGHSLHGLPNVIMAPHVAGRHARSRRSDERADRAQYPKCIRRRGDPSERDQSGRALIYPIGMAASGSVRRILSEG